MRFSNWILAAVALTVGLSASPAQAGLRDLFKPKKQRASCIVLTEHPGSGGIGRTVPAKVLDNAGKAVLSLKVDVVSGVKTLRKNVVVDILIETDKKKSRKMSVKFTDAQKKTFHSSSTLMRERTLASVTWQDWPKSQAYLEVRCLIEKVK